MLMHTHAQLEEYGRKWVAQIQENILYTDTFNYVPRVQREEMAASVAFSIDGNTFTISANEYVFTYEYGRGPTLNPGDGAVRRNVLAYLKEENISPQGVLKNGKPLDLETLAFFISRKIHNEGSLLFRTRSQSGVLSTVINDNSVEELTSSIVDLFIPTVMSSLLNAREAR